MTTTIRLSDSLVDNIDAIVAGDYRYTNRSHFIECVLQGFVEGYDLGAGAQEDDDSMEPDDLEEQDSSDESEDLFDDQDDD